MEIGGALQMSWILKILFVRFNEINNLFYNNKKKEAITKMLTRFLRCDPPMDHL